MVEMATIFHHHGPQYRARFGSRMPSRHHKVMHAIERCRTPVLGGHVYHCPECEEIQYLYHSCRNRHCPKCQNNKAHRWLEKQQDFLLPTPYFLLTFTLPSQLRQIARSHQKILYDTLFRASAAAIQHLSQDPRFVGGQMGFVGVLHTWGRNLSYHPHVHYLAPGGGLSSDGQTWLSSRKNFLFPSKALSPIFRAKFRDALRQTDLFALVPPEVWQQDWVVHCKAVGNGLHALKYLAPYIFRVAISNSRILKLANGKVTFRYRTSDTGSLRTSTLDAEEFIRRFLQHVLPKGFVKVRYFGFFSPSYRQRLAALRQLLTLSLVDLPQSSETPDSNTITSTVPPNDPPASHIVLCPSCHSPMQRRSFIRPRPRCPPELLSV
jgi:hypothetical protein